MSARSSDRRRKDENPHPVQIFAMTRNVHFDSGCKRTRGPKQRVKGFHDAWAEVHFVRDNVHLDNERPDGYWTGATEKLSRFNHRPRSSVNL